MSAIDLLFGIHNHQPVGNFEHVFEETYETCYKPQIQLLSEHPGVRMSLHHSGPLLEWIESNHPEYFDMVAKMVERGQVEILSGGFYEPILSSIPERDAVGQIVMMNDYIKNRFGYEPVGMWTAERIWDPYLPKIIAQTGLKYTILDDTHFYYTGLTSNDMFGYYTTEKHGATLSVFPIDKNLRYTIPFRLPHETIDYILRLKDEMGVESVTYADDGEKFGSWPDTYKWVYEEKWLHNFYTALEENHESIQMSLFSEFLEKQKSRGRIYLPMASYEEMMEWALPAESGARFEKALHELDDIGKREEWKPFIRGGLWDNFLTKYDESNRMHKKMLHVSQKIADAEKGGKPKKTVKSAKQALYKGQCNCAYWHGLFGGLYLNYLRHALYENLIKAENILDNNIRKTKSWINVERFDFDMDGADDVVIENPSLFTCFDPDYGGCLAELDYRPAAFSLTNTLTRRPEAYHKKIIAANAGKTEGEEHQPASIHDIVRLKEPDLAEKLHYDHYLRRCFQDHFILPDVTIDDFRNQSFDELGDFMGTVYEIDNLKCGGNEASLTLSRHGLVSVNEARHPVTVSKTFWMNKKDACLTATYKVTNYGASAMDCRMGVELNLTLLAADADDRRWVIDGKKGSKLREASVDTSVKQIGMRDEWKRFQVNITNDKPVDVWRFPVETVSQSESGFESTYQGSSITLLRHALLPKGSTMEFTITLDIEKI